MTARSITAVCLLSVTIAGALSGCAGGGKAADADHPTDTASAAARPVTIPVVKKDRDRSYIVKRTATVKNEDYGDGIYGTVVISASTWSRHPDDNRHWLWGQVILTDGRSIACSEPRATIWDDFGVFESIRLPCEKQVPLADVARVLLRPAY